MAASVLLDKHFHQQAFLLLGQGFCDCQPNRTQGHILQEKPVSTFWHEQVWPLLLLGALESTAVSHLVFQIHQEDKRHVQVRKGNSNSLKKKKKTNLVLPSQYLLFYLYLQVVSRTNEKGMCFRITHSMRKREVGLSCWSQVWKVILFLVSCWG